METTMYIIWAAAIIIFAIVEASTVQLVSIWFVIGSIAGLISAFCSVTIPVQIIVFIAVSLVSLILTRPLVKKKLTPKIVSTNADRCIGQNAVVIETIDNLSATGQVKVDGKIWTARSSNDSQITEGKTVIVDRIDGVKLIVSEK